MIARYRERHFIGAYKCVDHEITVNVLGYYKHGGLYYFRTDQYNLLVLGEEDIVYTEEVNNKNG